MFPPFEVVDMRCRPSFLHRFFGAEAGTAEFETVRWMNRRVGSRDPDHFVRAPDTGALLGEMTAAGIGAAVVVARSTPSVRVSNDAVGALVAQGEGRLIGIASVDPLDLGPAAAVVEAMRAVTTLGLSGVNVDAGFYSQGLKADDARLFPLYEVCAAQGVPAFMMSGPTTPDLALNDPLAVDRVARDFPTLRIVCCHGFWPRVDDMLAVAFRYENVFVSPDMYVFAPGGERYVQAANGFLRAQFLFGTSYPFRPLGQSLADFRALPLTEETRAAALWDNPCRLFPWLASGGSPRG